MDELKTCPFCGGEIIYRKQMDGLFSYETESYCKVCHMHFVYIQNFSCSNIYNPRSRVALNPSFEELWNRRIPDGQLLMDILHQLEEIMKSGRAVGINKYLDLDGLLRLLQQIDKYHEGVSNDGR